MTEYITKDDAMRALWVDRYNWTSPNNAEAWWACGEMKIAIKENIKNIPPITDFVKHGKWIDPAAEDCYRCSVCEEYTLMEIPRLLYHYCPNCGAKMDEVING